MEEPKKYPRKLKSVFMNWPLERMEVEIGLIVAKCIVRGAVLLANHNGRMKFESAF
jgi:hypothetical protein